MRLCATETLTQTSIEVDLVDGTKASPNTSSLHDSSAPKTNPLIWFRRDLRIHDNTALSQLLETVQRSSLKALTPTSTAKELISKGLMQTVRKDSKNAVKALFIATPEQWLEHGMSLVQMDFTFRSLKELASELLNQLNIELHILQTPTFTDCIDLIENYCLQHNITNIASNYEYEVNEMNRDDIIEQRLRAHNINFKRYHDQCILPPKSVTTNEETMYKVFTPFYKKWQSILETSPPNLCPAIDSNLHESKNLNADSINKGASIKCSSIKGTKNLGEIMVAIDDCYQQTLRLFIKAYKLNDNDLFQLENAQKDFPAGEESACLQLQHFIADDIQHYNIGRDQPALEATSKLSAYLTIGAISPRLCYLKAQQALSNPNKKGCEKDIQTWISELAWRDFYRHVINDRPDIVKGNAYKVDTDQKVNWSYNEEDFNKWCEGKTGVPLVDAAMRCLNKTGFMHNRLRMVTAMFLTKDLLIDWRWGERYFMQKLIDGDFASNNGGWQWSASVGTDASPYFRIMNPFSQAKTHDKEAVFIKTWLPELTDVPANILHDEIKLRKALSNEGLFSQLDYPSPMVEHKQARLYAIDQFKG